MRSIWDLRNLAALAQKALEMAEKYATSEAMHSLHLQSDQFYNGFRDNGDHIRRWGKVMLALPFLNYFLPNKKNDFVNGCSYNNN